MMVIDCRENQYREHIIIIIIYIVNTPFIINIIIVHNYYFNVESYYVYIESINYYSSLSATYRIQTPAVHRSGYASISSPSTRLPFDFLRVCRIV